MAAPTDDGAWLDRTEVELSSFEIRTGAAPTAKRFIELLVLAIRRMRVPAGGIGLPYFDKGISQRRARAVDDPTLDTNPLALGVRASQYVAVVRLKYIEARLPRD